MSRKKTNDMISPAEEDAVSGAALGATGPGAADVDADTIPGENTVEDESLGPENRQDAPFLIMAKEANIQLPDKVKFSSFGQFFGETGFSESVESFQKYAHRKTGYSNLDAVQPFYPGFYVIGATSSIGKTTFIHQMADQLAVQGENILFFSIEQTEFELFSKTISRSCHKTYLDLCKESDMPVDYPTPSSIMIRTGEFRQAHPREMEEQCNACVRAIGNRLTVVNTGFSITVESIIEIIHAYIKTTGCKPVVIIDYLQAIASSTDGKRRLDSKESIDHIVETLKTIQMEQMLTIVVISSFNRQSYTSPIVYESFKESGGIEYTADVLWGIQFSVVSKSDLFNQDGQLNQKKKKIEEAAKELPRKVDLVCIKNRFGSQKYSVHFEYYSANDHFVPKEND